MGEKKDAEKKKIVCCQSVSTFPKNPLIQPVASKEAVLLDSSGEVVPLLIVFPGTVAQAILQSTGHASLIMEYAGPTVLLSLEQVPGSQMKAGKEVSTMALARTAREALKIKLIWLPLGCFTVITTKVLTYCTYVSLLLCVLLHLTGTAINGECPYTLG